MIILGIDPGTTSAGFGVLDCGSPVLKLLDCGLLKVTSGSRDTRLLELHQALKKLIEKWGPEVIAIEKLFFAKNAKTALQVSEARGVLLLTTALARLPAYEYTPLEVKKVITGDGKADKRQLEKMVRLTLAGARDLRAPDDVFDAIALALTYHFKEKSLSQRKGRLS